MLTVRPPGPCETYERVLAAEGVCGDRGVVGRGDGLGGRAGDAPARALPSASAGPLGMSMRNGEPATCAVPMVSESM